MKKLLFAALFLSAITASAQTKLNGVRYNVTKLTSGAVYQVDAHSDAFITVDTTGVGGGDTTFITLPDLMPNAPFYSTLSFGNAVTVCFQSPVDSNSYILISGYTNATSGAEKVNYVTTPYKLSISTKSVKLIWVGGMVGWLIMP